MVEGMAPKKVEYKKAADGGATEEAGAEASKASKGLASTLFSAFLLLAIFGTLFAIATPKFASSRRRANIRACYANQKTIAGAVEMGQETFAHYQLSARSGNGITCTRHGPIQAPEP